MQSFCIHCGFKAVYDSNPPRYCSGCGNEFNKAIKSKTSNSSRENDDDEDEDDDDESPSFNKRELAKDWYVEGPAIKLGLGSFQDLAINQSCPKANLPPREAPKDIQKLNGNALLKAVRQECAKPKTSREIG